MIKHDLIEQVGRIERARGIVGGASEEATHYFNQTSQYVKNLDINDFYECLVIDFESFDSELNLYFDDQCLDIPRSEFIDLNDLRTAITEHEIAEIEAVEAHDTSEGDFEVWEEQQFENFLKENDFPIRKGENGYRFSNQIVYEAWLESPELGLKRINELKSTEVKLPKSLKQLESDDCTDIRNHLSPSTRVVDL